MIFQLSSPESIRNAYSAVSSAFGGLQKRVDIDAYLKKISEFANVYAAGNDTDICAFAAMYANDTENRIAYITLIGVRPDKQRSGFGTELFCFCEKEAKEMGMASLKLEVNRHNIKAIEFYKKQGMKIEKKSSENGVYMIKTL